MEDSSAFSPQAQGLLTAKYLNGIPDDSRMKKEAAVRSKKLIT